MAQTYTPQFGKSTTLSSDMTIGETSSATLSSAAFTNFTSDFLVIDYDIPAKREVIKCTVTGTGISAITRGQDGTSAIAHSAGAKVCYAFVPSHYTAKADTAQEAWVAPTLLNSWANFGSSYAAAGYMKDSLGFVHIKGMIKNGTVNTDAFILPSGYRPSEIHLFAVNSNSAYGQLSVGTDGAVKPAVGNNTSFAMECIFKAEA